MNKRSRTSWGGGSWYTGTSPKHYLIMLYCYYNGPSVQYFQLFPDQVGGGVVVYGRWYTPPLWHMLAPDRRYSLFDRDRIKSFVGVSPLWVREFRGLVLA